MLLLAGIAKARDMNEFVSTIQLYQVVPRQLSKLVARLIVYLELIVALCILAGIGVYLATVVATVLFSGFTLAVLINLGRRNIFDCNCFGPYFKEKISVNIVIRNLLFITLCLWVLEFYDGYLVLESWPPGRITMQNYSVGPFFLLTAVVILSGLSILSAKITLKNFKQVKSNSPAKRLNL